MERTLRSEAVDYVVQVASREAVRHDNEASFPTEFLAALRETGLLYQLWPGADDAVGDLLEMVRLAAAIGGACTSSGLIFAMHMQQVDVIARHGSREIINYLDTHRPYLASATTEADGSPLIRPSTRLVEDGGRLEIKRSCPMVTGWRHADALVTTMSDPSSESESAGSLIFVLRTDARLGQLAAPWDPMGMRATDSGGITITASVPATQVIGPRHSLKEIAVDSLIPLAHIGWSAVWIGAARAAVRELVATAGRMPSWKVNILTEARLQLDVSAAYLWSVAHQVRAVRSTNTAYSALMLMRLNALKIKTARECGAIADMCLQAGGMTAYRKGSVIERIYRDLRAARLNNPDEGILERTAPLVALDRSVSLDSVGDCGA